MSTFGPDSQSVLDLLSGLRSFSVTNLLAKHLTDCHISDSNLLTMSDNINSTIYFLYNQKLVTNPA